MRLESHQNYQLKLSKKSLLFKLALKVTGFISTITVFQDIAHADGVPTGGAGPHLDPFINGPVADGEVGLAACGTPGEIVPPFRASVPWSLNAGCPPFTDNIFNSGIGWRWEIELDFIGINGRFETFINSVRTFVNYGPGVDIFLLGFQPDLGNSVPIPSVISPESPLGSVICSPGGIPANGETGTVCKQLISFAPFSIAWGTSVTEGALATPIASLSNGLNGLAMFPNDPSADDINFSFSELASNIVVRSEDDTISIDLTSKLEIPEPSTILSLITIGGIALSASKKKQG